MGTGANKVAKRRALIPDPRNDENLVVAQTHLAMIRFHNKVVDKLPARVPAGAAVHPGPQARDAALPVADAARLPAADLRSPAVVDDVFTNGRKLVEPDAVPTAIPTMPVEFSVAAFRLGHSMVRAAYNWNRRFPGERGLAGLPVPFSGTSGDLVRRRSGCSATGSPTGGGCTTSLRAGSPGLAAPGSDVNLAMRIDTRLTDPLADLPLGSFGGDDDDPDVTCAATSRSATSCAPTW